MLEREMMKINFYGLRFQIALSFHLLIRISNWTFSSSMRKKTTYGMGVHRQAQEESSSKWHLLFYWIEKCYDMQIDAQFLLLVFTSMWLRLLKYFFNVVCLPQFTLSQVMSLILPITQVMIISSSYLKFIKKNNFAF